LKNNPETKDIAIIFLSALDDPRDKVKGLKMGAEDYIAKPFLPEEVIARVATQLKVRHLEQALTAKNIHLKEKNERILQAIHEGILGIDSHRIITFVNPAATQIIGWNIDELTDQSVTMVIPPKPGSASVPEIDITLQTGITQHIASSMFRHYDGSQIPISYSVTPMLDKNTTLPTGAVIVFNDISKKIYQDREMKRMRDEIQHQKDNLAHMSRLSCMGEMASGFAHEINQPLTAINNYAQASIRIIRQKVPNIQALTEIMDKIATQSHRAGTIVSRIKNFVRKPQNIFQVTDCNSMLYDIITLAEVDAKQNNVNIHLNFTDHLPPVFVDAIQIQQVALNLIRNAMEAMKNEPTQHIGVWVKTEKYDLSFVKVSVIDRGHGLSKDAEKKLFQPFYSTKSSGMGIGLSVCHSIIEAHQGTLDFHHNTEGGTIFTFTLPIAVNP
ncbi:MAG: ATP-binding protein, partial [Endozoicomonadaceae bacterium]|nr:ATP-binding protein [Endozoicomonadaceae bacterium]